MNFIISLFVKSKYWGKNTVVTKAKMSQQKEAAKLPRVSAKQQTLFMNHLRHIKKDKDFESLMFNNYSSKIKK